MRDDGRGFRWRAGDGAEMALAAAVGGLAVFVLTRPKASPPTPPAVEVDGPGRGARHPTEIPARGWRQILRRTWKEFNDDHVTVIAGGVTYSVLLALFPALAAFVSLYGLVANVDEIPHQIESLRAVLPSAAVGFIGDQMTRLAKVQHGGLSLALALSLLVSFWSANGAMKAFFVGLNIAYEAEEKRSILRLNLTTLGFTLGLILFVFVVSLAMAGGAAVPYLGPLIGRLIAYGRWPLLLLTFAGGLAVLYQFGPCHEQRRWRWVSPGSLLATVLWLAASLLYSIYTANFSHYNATYGSLGAVIGLMVWIWISAVIVLLGAELNGEVEHQTALSERALGKAASTR